jgi:hypothetical protein
MSNRRPPLSRRDAERLLDDPAASGSALGTALSAAGAPARPGELRREDAEVAAFHAARLTPPPTTRSNFVSPTRLGRRAATRAVIATGAVVALTSGGFALASSAHLPTLPGQASDQASASVAKTPTPTETTDTATQTPGESTEPTESADAEETEAQETEAERDDSTASATPTPSFEGLCKAFQATDHAANGSSLDSAAFLALAAEAGGADQVATYCVDLIGEPRETGKPSELPTPTGKPSDKPTGKPSVVPSPTSRPTPTTKPTDKPTPGKPTAKPAPAGKGGGRGSSTSGS